MQLPPKLHHAIEQKIAATSLKSLSKAASELSESYRAQRSRNNVFMATESHRLAYIATRMPATFAANHAVFSEIQSRLSEQRIESLLDLGAGPGTASWAATQTFSEIPNITLIERDAALIQMGKSLAQAAENARLQNATWMQKDLSQLTSFPSHDLIVCSYALNELSPEKARQVLKAAWSATRIALVLIEPGTMPGFDLIRQLRDDLIQLEGNLIAPCPHQETCPLPSDDWCHFSQRLNRTTFHRHLKIGHLGYEDEKFSYIAASKVPADPAQARVLRHPIRRSGHTQMQLCTKQGLQNITITRSDKPNWRRVKKTNWGDAW